MLQALIKALMNMIKKSQFIALAYSKWLRHMSLDCVTGTLGSHYTAIIFIFDNIVVTL